MSAGSIAVVVLLFALVGLALWRNFKKGAPCSCGGSRKECGRGCHCGCHGKEACFKLKTGNGGPFAPLN